MKKRINWVNVIIYFILFYIILYLLAYLSLSKLDRMVLHAIPMAIKAHSNEQCNSPSYVPFYKWVYYFFLGVGGFLITPFRIILTDDAFALTTRGSLYNTYSVPIEKLKETNDKLKIHFMFLNSNLPTPKLYAYSTESELITLEHIDQEQLYIMKPRYGCFGNDISLVKGKDIKHKPDYLIQQYLKDCKNKARNYRVITMYDGTVFLTLQYTQQTSLVSSNCSKGSELTYDPIPEQIHSVASECCKFHTNHYNILSLGWDLMYDCKTKKAYVLEVNTSHGLGKCKRGDIKRYKNYAKKFYNIYDTD